MTKKSSGRKRGIRRCIPRHRIGGNEAVEGQEAEANDEQETNLLCFRRSKLSTFAHKCVQILMVSCEKCHLVGFTRSKNGEYVRLSRKDQIWHYAAIGLCLMFWIQKTWGTVQLFFHEELGLQSFLGLSVSLVFNCAVLCGLGIVMRPTETMDLHNSWAHMSASVRHIDSHNEFRPHDNISACIKIISVFLVCQGIAIAVAAVSLFMSDISVFWLPMLAKSGILPTSLLPRWAWQITFALVEWLVALPFMLITPFSASFLFTETGVLKEYLRQLRKIKVRGLQSRRRLEQMYVQLELFNRIAQVWIRFFFPAWLVELAIAVIVTAFVTIRYTELPLFVYIFFPYSAVSLMLLIILQSYDMFRTVRASEDILGGLLQHQAPYFEGMSRANRIEKMKRAKAMRVLVFSIADSEFSLNLPINTWDEIINQLLFLLSL